jgi:hypothetical protein
LKNLLKDKSFSAIMRLQVAQATRKDLESKLDAWETEIAKIAGSLSSAGQATGIISGVSWKARGELEGRIAFLAGLVGEAQNKVKDLDTLERQLKEVLKLTIKK